MPSGRDSKGRIVEDARVGLAASVLLPLGQVRFVALPPLASLARAITPTQYRPTPQGMCLAPRVEQPIYLSFALSFAQPPRGPPGPT